VAPERAAASLRGGGLPARSGSGRPRHRGGDAPQKGPMGAARGWIDCACLGQDNGRAWVARKDINKPCAAEKGRGAGGAGARSKECCLGARGVPPPAPPRGPRGLSLRWVCGCVCGWRVCVCVRVRACGSQQPDTGGWGRRRAARRPQTRPAMRTPGPAGRAGPRRGGDAASARRAGAGPAMPPPPPRLLQPLR
jgi:hypothetical protein